MNIPILTNQVHNHANASSSLMLRTFREAPPTRKPSISSCLASSALLAAFTEPVQRVDCHCKNPQPRKCSTRSIIMFRSLISSTKKIEDCRTECNTYHHR
ncbi:hypothetical protein Mapa_007785 [Marchantia paleacea]|nr:hypothetical protein Mapa_007785 [Marchantia paleacea]